MISKIWFISLWPFGYSSDSTDWVIFILARAIPLTQWHHAHKEWCHCVNLIKWFETEVNELEPQWVPGERFSDHRHLWPSEDTCVVPGSHCECVSRGFVCVNNLCGEGSHVSFQWSHPMHTLTHSWLRWCIHLLTRSAHHVIGRTRAN